MRRINEETLSEYMQCTGAEFERDHDITNFEVYLIMVGIRCVGRARVYSEETFIELI